MNNASLKMKNVFITAMKHISTGFFTADTAGAIHDYILVFCMLQHFCSHRQLLAESIGRDFNGTLKMPYLIFIMVSHVYNDGIRIIGQLVEFFGIYITSFVFHVESRVLYTICHDLFTDLDLKYPE